MPNSYPTDGIFNLHRRTIMFILLPFSCILFLRQLHLDLNMCCFINFTLKSLYFLSRKVRCGSFLIRWRRNVWGKLMWKWRQYVKNDIKMSKSSYWRPAGESSYTPHVRRHFLAAVGFTEIPVGYARKTIKCTGRIMTSSLFPKRGDHNGSQDWKKNTRTQSKVRLHMKRPVVKTQESPP